MDHSTHIPLQGHERTEESLENAAIYGPDNENVGKVSRVHGHGPAAKMIVDVGGFLGLGVKQVAIDAERLTFMRDGDNAVHARTSLTKEDLKALPEYQD